MNSLQSSFWTVEKVSATKLQLKRGKTTSFNSLSKAVAAESPRSKVSEFLKYISHKCSLRLQGRISAKSRAVGNSDALSKEYSTDRDITCGGVLYKNQLTSNGALEGGISKILQKNKRKGEKVVTVFVKAFKVLMLQGLEKATGSQLLPLTEQAVLIKINIRSDLLLEQRHRLLE